MKKKGFEKSIDVDFEGFKFKLPYQWNEYLEHMYGDYMTLPPIEKRTGRHNVVFVEL